LNLGYAQQHQGKVAWDGAAPAAIDLRHHIGFGFTFEVVQTLANDTVFNVMSAPPDVADNCLPGPWEPVADIIICDYPAQPAAQATITLPTGTVAGSLCTASLPCKPDAFISIQAASGDTGSVRAVAILSGPR